MVQLILLMDQKTVIVNFMCEVSQFRYTGTYRLKVKKWIKIYHANRIGGKTGIGILKSDKINKDFITKTVTRDKEGH